MTEETRGTVVVGYDGSAHAGTAVDWAAVEAVRRGVPLTVVYAADYAGLVPGPLGTDPWLPDQVTEVAGQLLAEGVERARKAAPDVAAATLLRGGSASGVLVDASGGAALLVVGNRGHGELAGALLGSVAFAVSAHARCPVVVVRGDGSVRPGPDRPVVAGVDGSAASAAAVRFAAETAAQAGAPLTLVAAWHPAAAETWEASYLASLSPGKVEQAAKRAARDVTAVAAQDAAAVAPELQVREELVGGAAGPVLADASRGAGMVVVGARGRGGFAGLLLGSVSHIVIHRAACPVAVVRA